MTARPRHPLRFVRQWDPAAPLPDIGVDLNADSPRIPDLWRVRRNLGPVYSMAWEPAVPGQVSAPAAWPLLPVEDDGYAKGGTHGILVASLRLDALLEAALATGTGLLAELSVPAESGATVRVRSDPSSVTSAPILQIRDLSRPGGAWSLTVGLRNPTPMFGGSGVVLVAGVIGSIVRVGFVFGTREVRPRADRFEDRAARNESKFELLASRRPTPSG